MTIGLLQEEYEDRLQEILKENFAAKITDITNVHDLTEAMTIEEFITKLEDVDQPA